MVGCHPSRFCHDQRCYTPNGDQCLCGEEHHQSTFRSNIQGGLSIFNQSCCWCGLVILFPRDRYFPSRPFNANKVGKNVCQIVIVFFLILLATKVIDQRILYFGECEGLFLPSLEPRFQIVRQPL